MERNDFYKETALQLAQRAFHLAREMQRKGKTLEAIADALIEKVISDEPEPVE